MYVAVTDQRAKMIEQLLARYGLSNRWLADKLKRNHTSVGDWLNPDGNHPRDRSVYDQMLTILQQFGPEERNQKLAPIGMRIIPVHGPIAAGKPVANYADTEWEEVPDWGGEFDRWGRIIDGESMMDVLQPRDIAVFENRGHELGDVVHAEKDGDDCVKATRGPVEDPQLASFNVDFPPFSAKGWQVRGVCVGRIRYGRFGVRSYTSFPTGLKWSMRNENF